MKLPVGKKNFLIGTHNRGKFREISQLISKKYKKISPTFLKIPSPKETGKTFRSNAILKVQFFSKFVECPVITDDSGLCIKSLNYKPGIFSARLAKRAGGFNSAMKNILKRMKNKKERSAYFVCSLSVKFPKCRPITVEGKVHGQISKKILGKKGFGYDSIFVPINNSLTFGQMSRQVKSKIDHRYIAFKKLKKKVRI